MSKIDSKYLSYILRHKPEDAGLTLDEYGYADVQLLCEGLGISKADLEEIVASNTRYLFNGSHTKIKAAHGHSVKVKYENECEPPEFLYHGTADRFLSSIMSLGLKPQSRSEVHLTESKEEALKIGLRHTGGSEEHVVVLKIAAKRMHDDSHRFHKSEDNVWLVADVPCGYISEE